MYKLLFLLPLIAGGFSQGASAADGWMKYSSMRSVFREMGRKGMAPVGVACRNSPKAKVTARPEIKVQWAKAGNVKDWVVYLHRGTNTIYPFNLLKPKPKEWRVSGKKKFRAGPSRSIYSCYFWLKK